MFYYTDFIWYVKNYFLDVGIDIFLKPAYTPAPACNLVCTAGLSRASLDCFNYV